MMTRMLRLTNAIAGGFGLIVLAIPVAVAEALPMPLARYADLCQQTGGSLALHLTSGVGIVQCQWPGDGSTECKVGGDQVTVCGISCRSNACLKENPARYSPTWPLAGGPNSASLPALPGRGTLAPSN